MRPTTNKYYFNILNVVAQRSPCLKRKLGAILVKDNHIISTGYNGPSTGIKHCTKCLRENIPSGEGHSLVECPACHAEMNAIIFAAIHGTSIQGSTLYISAAPCFDCVKYIINAGIRKIIIPENSKIIISVYDLLYEANINIELFNGD